MSDQIHNLTAEVEQLFMQNDFDGAKCVLEKFFQSQNEEIERLRKTNTMLRSRLSAFTEAANRRSRHEADYLPYPDDDYRD